MKTDILSSEKSGNAFDALRVAAALAVLYSHSFILYGLPEPVPMAGQALGSLAVALFFAVSGFLICQSWERDPHLGRYAARRALRILPGLWVVVLLTALVVGALYTTASLSGYFGSFSPWRYIATGGLAMGSPKLLGVFESNPLPSATNGSLWTLKYEIIMYLLLGILGRYLPGATLKAKCSVAFLVCAGLWLFFATKGYQKVALPFAWRLGTEIYLDRMAYLGAFFFAGACSHLYFERIRLSRALALILIAPLPFIDHPVLVMALLWFVVPYGVLVFAFKAPAICRKMNGFDYSYGIYIYAFPIQQIVSLLGRAHQWSWGIVLVVSALATVLLAALSWNYVERPALRLKRFIAALGTRPAASVARTAVPLPEASP